MRSRAGRDGLCESPHPFRASTFGLFGTFGQHTALCFGQNAVSTSQRLLFTFPANNNVIVVQSAYCCSVVTVDRTNTVHALTLVFSSPDGGVMHYEGERGQERVVSRSFSSGSVLHFEGERGQERMVRKLRPDGIVQHYEGERGQERLVRLAACSTSYYEGEKGHERMVRQSVARRVTRAGRAT